MKKGKKNAFSLFLSNFIKSAICLAILIGAGMASYKVTMAYFDLAGGPKDDKVAGIISEYFGGEVEIEDISKNLILCQDEEGEVQHILLEVFNTNTKNLDYITIPANTRFTISNELYQKLCAAGSEAPQIIRLEDADSYFSKETLYEYMVILVEDMLKIDVGYYTVVPPELFGQVFAIEEVALSTEGEAPVTASYGIYRISDDFLEETRKLTDEDALKEYLKELSGQFASSLPLRGRYEYIPAYLGISREYIYAYGVYGTEQEGYFDIALEESRDLAAKTIDNPIPYESAQSFEEQGESLVSSEGYNIEVLNASGITGLAASYRSLLEENGYTVAHIGNYTLGTLTESKIIVKEEGMGEDLLAFLGGGTVEEGALPEGIDIQILLGTMAER